MYASSFKTTLKTKTFIFLIICASLLYAEQNDKCPETVSTWREKESNFSCGRDKYYHCLKDEKQRTIQRCLGRSWVQPGFCPEYNSIASEIDVFLCKESLGECPVATFWSNELYKYSACLNAVGKSETEKQVKGDGNTREDKNEGLSVIIIIVISSCSVLLVLAVALISWCVLCRRKDIPMKEINELPELQKPTTQEHNTNSREEDIESAEPFLNDRYNASRRGGERVGDQQISQRKNKEPPIQIDYDGLSQAEMIQTLLGEYLRRPGDKLLLILRQKGDVYTIEQEMKKRDPGYIKIDSFDDWPKAADKENHTVLLSWVLRACTNDCTVVIHRGKFARMESDLKEWKVQCVIPVYRETFEIEKNNLLSFEFFHGIECHTI